MEQTAVEWLINELRGRGYIFFQKKDIQLIEQAKEIFEQQIIEAYDEAEGKIIGKGEQYYNETFKNK